METSPAASLSTLGQSALGDLNLDYGALFLLFVTVCAFMIPVAVVLPPVPVRKSDALLQTHTRAGVGKAKSNLNDQHAAAHAPKDGRLPTIRSLLIYPVKSCRGVEVTRGRVLPQGLEFDRLFTFAQLKSPFPVSLDSTDEAKSQHRWEFITQRQFPRLATVKVDLWLPDEMKLRRQSMKSTKEAFLILRFPWKEDGWRGLLSVAMAKLSRGTSAEPEKEILLPVDFPSAAEIKDSGYTFEEVKIWKEVVRALDMSTELPRELMLYLGVSNKLGLFRVDPAKLREVYRCAPRKGDAGYQPVTGFQDAYPLHMMTLNSLQQFSEEVPKDDQLEELDARRFRPNIILSGVPAYDEETWKKARFRPGKSGLYNDAVFHVSCRTVRCKMPNVDPITGERHPREPDHSLRTRRDVDKGAPLNGCLGMQLTPLFEVDEAPGPNPKSGSGLLGDDNPDDGRSAWVAVGMTVEVEERGEHLYIKQ
ncbi:putative MOSC domain-containing protein [Rosellinia necatrix]|uniref:Putative MOSC domain-containing protein n=1 Tax=Rosellinia necatrix TaxID=77044 RepID=A0A1S7UH69_ROSNE|nr:putative MOSC domain-containing protein [Rosellinia necatrix]